MSTPRLERKADVLKRTGYSATALRRAIAQGLFPKPKLLPGTARVPVWDSADVDRFISRITKEQPDG
jgi:predicted DNA-binding transcriptional regulator AlpA